MPENTTLYRIALSSAGGLVTGLMGLLAGFAWGLSLGVSASAVALAAGALAFIWGAISFQLTPTGGVIMENRTTVNYAVVATHGYIVAMLCFVALIVYLVRTFALG